MSDAAGEQPKGADDEMSAPEVSGAIAERRRIVAEGKAVDELGRKRGIGAGKTVGGAGLTPRETAVRKGGAL